MDITLLLIGLSFLLLWLFKQRHRTTQIIYPIVGGVFIVAFVLVRFVIN